MKQPITPELITSKTVPITTIDFMLDFNKILLKSITLRITDIICLKFGMSIGRKDI